MLKLAAPHSEKCYPQHDEEGRILQGLCLGRGQDSIDEFFPEAEYHTHEKEFQQILNDAINRLPEKQRQAFILSKQQFLKREEVAKVLNFSPETVKSNLERAMKSVRTYCQQQLKDLPFVLLLFFFSKNL